MRRKHLLIISFLLILILPVVGSFLRVGRWPEGFGLFPARHVPGDPPFSQPMFNFFAAGGVVILAFLFFPGLFGFKKLTVSKSPEKIHVNYPSWFLPSIIICVLSWVVMWARLKHIHPLDHFTFVPLWWSFIFVIDGLVYKRNNGRSLISSRPNTMKLLAVASTFSWFVFEYQNFFVMGNWYYPNHRVLSNFGNISWQLLSYTTVLPAIFEWYWLLRTFRIMNEKYSQGPKIRFNDSWQWVFLGIGLALTLLMAYYPYELFWVLWVSLIPVMVPAMSLRKLWNPFTPIAQKGDWSFFVLIAIATLINGFFWEFWNFGSNWFHPTDPTNPNFWKYSVPYLDKYHIFSEMPVLGYFGYLLFGVVCWVLWLTVAYIVGFNPRVHEEDIPETASTPAENKLKVVNG